jgi:hypothetical protein
VCHVDHPRRKLLHVRGPLLHAAAGGPPAAPAPPPPHASRSVNESPCLRHCVHGASIPAPAPPAAVVGGQVRQPPPRRVRREDLEPVRLEDRLQAWAHEHQAAGPPAVAEERRLAALRRAGAHHAVLELPTISQGDHRRATHAAARPAWLAQQWQHSLAAVSYPAIQRCTARWRCYRAQVRR